ncbi:MAG: putative transport protein [Limisphaerales bacterium]
MGTIKIGGSSLGVAAILFTGLIFGSLSEALVIPDIIFLLGLSIFVYSVGLSSGPAFFKSYQKNGLRDFLFSISMLVFSGIMAAVIWTILDLSAASITGIYTGSTTNTAALAGVIDYINNSYEAGLASSTIQETVVGYSYSYPIGVFGSMIAIVLMERFFKIDYKKEQKELRDEYPLEDDFERVPILVTNANVEALQIRDLYNKHGWKVVFGRIVRDGESILASRDIALKVGDTVVAVGNSTEIENAILVLGSRGDENILKDRGIYDSRRIFVSNTKLVGRTLASINLSEKYNAMVTRIRRGDIDMLANGDTILEQGDRIRFIARKEELNELSELFGDSYHESSKVNLFSFGLGIGLGLILGTINFKFGPTIEFKLGYAGGPLVVGLILGSLRRTGPIIWALPFSANITLQQIGLIFLLATIGVRSGHAFVDSFSMEGLTFFLAGGLISILTACVIISVGYKVLKMPFSLLMGMVSNQPAILDFATNRSGNRIPLYGFAMMFPIALITKVLIAQILFLVLQ